MLAEALIRTGAWPRSVGICDGPSSMLRAAAAVVGQSEDAVYLDYFGLNHLGWVRRVLYNGRDYLPEIFALAKSAGGFPGLPFDLALLETIGMFPNEYLYYFYSSRTAVQNILRAEETRGEEITRLNREFFSDLLKLKAAGNTAEMYPRYERYLDSRHGTYMSKETSAHHTIPPVLQEALAGGEGYAGVALDLIEGLTGVRSVRMILNIANHGAIHGMEEEDVVEIPAQVSTGAIRPLAVGKVPDASLGLMLQVKEYERLTIQAAVEGSYTKALLALTIHPLVKDIDLARKILDGYIAQHGPVFPHLA
jgi:6-phospho-beta-glucosidase